VGYSGRCCGLGHVYGVYLASSRAEEDVSVPFWAILSAANSGDVGDVVFR
jgi:hypothetical protein